MTTASSYRSAPMAPQRTPPRGALVLEVVGGVAFAFIVSRLVATVAARTITGSGWGVAIGWESVWLVTAIVCCRLMRTGVRHDITVQSTLRGLLLDWPELIVATYTLVQALAYGLPNGVIKPAAFALSVGSSEEFLFRVLLLGWLVTRLEPPTALLVSSAVFGMAHVQVWSIVGLMSVVPQFSGGMVLGAIYLRTRNPLGGILSHAYWDLPFFLALGSGVTGGSAEGGMPSPQSVLFWCMFAVYGLWLVRPGMDVAGSEHHEGAPLMHQA